MSPARVKVRVVVDGSNLATEGRVTPSLGQLDEAVRAFAEENPGADVIVVVDASFEHRVPPSERAQFAEAVLAGEVVTPPAGAVGRGDAFILKIADRIGGIVLSNDSFQEFHESYPWLFDEGRLIGGKPVRGVGWIFTPRNPVRSPKALRQAKKTATAATAAKAAPKLPAGVVPTIGTTLTPVAPAKRATKRAAKAPAAAATTTAKAPRVAPPAKAPAPAKTRAAKAPRAAKVAVKPAGAAPAIGVAVSPVAPTKRATKRAAAAPAAKAPPAKSARAAKATKAPRKAKAAAPAAPSSSAPGPAVALRRGRQPVNPEGAFTRFVATHRVGTRVSGEVTAFTSHGAVITVELKDGGRVECYAPTTLLGDPAPARARDVLARGERRTFKLVTVDPERRIAELALV